MVVVINNVFDFSGSSNNISGIFENEESFKLKYNENRYLNDNEPRKYPVLVIETGISSSPNGALYQHFLFFYDFTKSEE